MKKLRCIIADDEPVARKILKEFIEQMPNMELTAEFRNAMKTEAFLQDHEADLLFLDINMPRISGLQFLKKVTVRPLVILTTAYPEYALEGYELDIIDYLLKPIAFTRFQKAVKKAGDFIALREKKEQDSPATFLFVKSEKRIEKIELGDILYVEGMGNYVNICTGNKKIVAYLTLKAIENRLPPEEFIKVHQSFIIPVSRIEFIEGNQIKIKEMVVPIGRNYKDIVMKLVDERLLKR
ncbi:MAG TPA: LytTR family DNA-binding domain-containing protein [Chitinophagaceae bacterium]|nr:LytTR family DNA-binding domain-containing protein [Chitinophagaceae bacterium]